MPVSLRTDSFPVTFTSDFFKNVSVMIPFASSNKTFAFDPNNCTTSSRISFKRICSCLSAGCMKIFPTAVPGTSAKRLAEFRRARAKVFRAYIKLFAGSHPTRITAGVSLNAITNSPRY